MFIGILWTTRIVLNFVLVLGYDDLSVNKNATQKDIASSCNYCVAQLAVDRNISTCMRTEAIGKTSGEHNTWWDVDLGGVQSVYNIRIQFRKDTNNMTQRGRFAGFSLFVSNTTHRQNESLCYKDGEGIPSLDFNTTCTKHGRYVIFYNERLVGTTYPQGYENSSVFTELCEVTVTGCSMFGVYGDNCDKPCPQNCQERRCDIISGKCLGCLPGWIGDECNGECTAGYFGLECKSKCVGHCKDNIPCNHINGTCVDGCKDGYTGSDCKEECPFAKYGPDCLYNCSGNCLDGMRCNLSTGRCDNSCKAGFTGEHCDKDCESGTFGKNCSSLCSGNCKDNITCNSANGYCYRSCAAGFLGDYCNMTCEDGKYGQNCTQNCSTYCIDGLCNNVDGSCYCTQENNGHSECNKHCPIGLYGQDCRSICSQGCKNEACKRENGYCTLGCKTSFEGPECKIKAMLEIEDNREKSSAEFIEGGVGGGTGIIILVLVGIFFLRHRRNKRRASHERTDNIGCSTIASGRRYYNTGINTILDEDTDKESKSLTSQSPKKLDILIQTLADFKDTQIEREYKTIPKGELHPCVTGKRKENQSKNRYTTIFPYDHSRVVLDTSTYESDYINANYIEDVFGGESYIATQGPKTGTIVDYWRMVWQENARILVCLTNISEAKTKKCAKYWPDLNDKLLEGVISVRCQKEQIYAENIFRHLRIQNNMDKAERDVYMFHYTQWPDHGVPEPLSLVVFHRHVMKTAAEHPMGYIVVNCSAGVGRTGTFIALDALYKEGEKTGNVNVPQYVEKMRNARMNMVQGEDQYKIVYMALLEAFRGRLRAIPVDCFLKEFQNLSKESQLAKDFEELLSIRKVYTKEDYESGRLNITANYCPSVLPVEKYLCPLISTTENLYYNAVYLQSFTRSDRFISAQFTLPDYTEDFLTLVKTYNAYTVVSLYPLDDVQSTSLWLPTKNQHKEIGKFTMNMTECLHTEYMARTNMTLQEKGGSKMRVAVLECKCWENEYDNKNIRVLIDLIQETKIEERTHPNGRILVLSSDGATRCGPFCAVFNVLEQMMLDGEVDLFTITRQLQTRRPEFLSSFEEYKFCHDTISDYLQNDTLYANV